MTLFRSRAHLQRQHARELDKLLNVIERQADQICHMAGRPWTLPPRPVDPPSPQGEPADENLVDIS